LALAERLAEDSERVGPLLARSIKAESGVDISELGKRRASCSSRRLAATTISISSSAD